MINLFAKTTLPPMEQASRLMRQSLHLLWQAYGEAKQPLGERELQQLAQFSDALWEMHCSAQGLLQRQPVSKPPQLPALSKSEG